MKTELNDFEYQGKMVKLKTPIILEVSKVKDFYYAANNEIELYGSGKTQTDAIENAKELFSGLYILSKKILDLVDFKEFDGKNGT